MAPKLTSETQLRVLAVLSVLKGQVYPAGPVHRGSMDMVVSMLPCHPASPPSLLTCHPSSLATIPSHHHPSSPALPLDLAGSRRATCRSKIPKELQQSNFTQAQSLRGQARLIKTMVPSSLLIKASTPHATIGKRQSGDTAIETAHLR